MKQTIRPTESELRGMINEAVKKALNDSDYQVPDNINNEDGIERIVDETVKRTLRCLE